MLSKRASTPRIFPSRLDIVPVQAEQIGHPCRDCGILLYTVFLLPDGVVDTLVLVPVTEDVAGGNALAPTARE
jgi:hypothetical protein